MSNNKICVECGVEPVCFNLTELYCYGCYMDKYRSN